MEMFWADFNLIAPKQPMDKLTASTDHPLRTISLMASTTDFDVKGLTFLLWLCLWLTICPWESHLASALVSCLNT